MSTHGETTVPKCGTCKGLLVVPMVPKHTGHQFYCPVCLTEPPILIHEVISAANSREGFPANFRSFIPAGEISAILAMLYGNGHETDRILDDIRAALKI